MSSVISFQTVIPNLRLRSDAWRVFEANTVRNVLISSSTRASSLKKKENNNNSNNDNATE